MTDTGRCTGFAHKTVPRYVVVDEPGVHDLQGHWASQIDIKGLQVTPIAPRPSSSGVREQWNGEVNSLKLSSFLDSSAPASD
jgi:hypothetical protein